MIFPGKILFVALAHLFKKPITVLYPAVKVTMPARFRGKLKFDAPKCIGCKLCMRDCPANAISIRKIADKVFSCDIDSSKCIYCAQCVDSCPKKALEATGEFELASLTKDTLMTSFEGTVPPSGAAAGPAAGAHAAEAAKPAQPPKTETNNDPTAGS